MAELQINIKSAGSQQAAADIGKLNQTIQQTEQVTEKQGLSAMKNFRMTNQMGGAFQGAAMQLSGFNGFGQQAFMMMDRLGDTIERTKIHGGSMKDVFSGMKAEMGMIASAGIIAAVAFAFKALNDDMKETVKVWDEVNAGYERMELDRLKTRLTGLDGQFQSGAISVEDYRAKVIALNEKIIQVESQAKITALRDQIKGLQDTMSDDYSLKGNLLTALDFYTGSQAQKIEAWQAQVQQIESDSKQKILVINGATEEKITAKKDEEYKKRLALKKTADDQELAQIFKMQDDEIKANVKKANLMITNDSIIAKNHKAYLIKTKADQLAFNEWVIADEIRIANLKRQTAWQTANSLSVLAQAIYESTGSKNKAMLAAAKALAVADVGVQSVRAIWKAYGEMGPWLGSIAAAAIAGKAAMDIGRITAAGTGGGVPEAANVAIAQPTFATADAGGPATGGTGGTGATTGGSNMASTNAIAQVNFTQTIMIQGNVIAGDFLRMLREYTEMGVRAGGGRMATI